MGDRPRVAPPNTRTGHELGYVFTQWEGHPRADSRGDGEGKLYEILMKSDEIWLIMKMMMETYFRRRAVL